MIQGRMNKIKKIRQNKYPCLGRLMIFRFILMSQLHELSQLGDVIVPPEDNLLLCDTFLK